jgi:hypothetical protein
MGQNPSSHTEVPIVSPHDCKTESLQSETLLQEWPSELRKRSNINRWLNVICFPIAIWAIVYCALSFFRGTNLSSAWMLPVHLMNVGSLGITYLAKARLSSLTEKNIDALSDVRYVGPLTEAATITGRLALDKTVITSARRALIRLLPVIQCSDGFMLNPAQRGCLRKLALTSDIDLSRAILRAWQQIGTVDEIPVVENLVAQSPKKPIAPEIQEEAESCLPYLIANAEREKQRNTLLRAAEPSTESEVSLLRPAASVPESAEAQLLRPVD